MSKFNILDRVIYTPTKEKCYIACITKDITNHSIYTLIGDSGLSFVSSEDHIIMDFSYYASQIISNVNLTPPKYSITYGPLAMEEVKKDHICNFKTYTGLMYKEEFCECGIKKNRRGIYE